MDIANLKIMNHFVNVQSDILEIIVNIVSLKNLNIFLDKLILFNFKSTIVLLIIVKTMEYVKIA